MSIKLNDLNIIGLDNIDKQLNNEYKKGIKEINLFFLIISFIFVFLCTFIAYISIGTFDNNYLITQGIMLFVVFVSYSIIRIDFKLENKHKLSESKLIDENILNVRCEIGDRTNIYINDNKSILVKKVEFCDIEKPILDFENKILKLKIN